jgi:hypothetical protein
LYELATNNKRDTQQQKEPNETQIKRMKTRNMATKQQTTKRRTAPPAIMMTATSTNRQLTDTKTRTTSTAPSIQEGRLRKMVEILLILIHIKYITNDKKVKVF